MLTVASQRKAFIKHVDVVTTYLNGELEEIIFMRQPEGYATGDGRTVCRLRRSLYGLKESARKKNGKTAYILIYVHDMVIVMQAMEEFKSILENLQRRFIMEKTRPSEIPLDPGYFQYKEEVNQLLNNCPDYLSLIGGHLYVAMHQRPDIAVSISVLAQKLSCSNQQG